MIDFVPTLLELAGVTPRETWNDTTPPPLPGRSIAAAFARDGSVTRDCLYFHHEGNRALIQGDWKLVSAREDNDAWELFDLSGDRCEMNNLLATHGHRAKDMEAKWHELDARFRQQAGPATQPAGKPKPRPGK